MVEVLYGSSAIHKPEALRRNATAVIGFAGAYSGGSNNAQYEQMLEQQFGRENTLAVSSASTKFAFREGMLSARSFRNGDYYRSLAVKAIDQFPSKETFLIHCQSGGGTEGLAFTRALLENPRFRAKKIKILFSGVPGFSEKSPSKIGRTIEFLKRFIDLSINRAQYQQFDLCPPPEEYYAYYKKLFPQEAALKNEGKVVYEDSPKTRQTRRERFFNHYMHFLSPAEKVTVTQQISGLDESIKSLIASPDRETKKHLEELLHQRGKLVFSIGGDRYYENVANQPDYKNVPDAGFDGSVVGIHYIMRLLGSVAQGMEKKLRHVVELANQKKKTLEFSFGVFEKDAIFGARDIPTAKKRLSQNQLTDKVTDWLIIEGLSHESVDNSSQGIAEALMKLYDSSVQ